MESREPKNKFWKGVLVGALVMAFTGLIIVGISAGIFLIGRTVIDNPAGQVVTENGQEEDLDYAMINSKIRYIQGIIDQYFLYDEDMEQVEDSIYMGMMYGLEDPYAMYYNEEDYAALMEDTSGKYCGIGAMVQQNRLTGIMTIVKVFETGPAYEAGLRPGDILYKVEGEEVAGQELDLLISEKVKGEEGTFVGLTVLRGEEGEEVDIRIERRQVEVPTVEHEMLEDNIGYISVLQFELVTSDQFEKAVEDLEGQGMEKLIIDLRDNPGGVLDTAVKMMAYVLPDDKFDGMLIYTEDKDGNGERYYSRDGKIMEERDDGRSNPAYPMEDGHQLDIPIAVLVNENSASASELFSGALQDYEAGILVGTQTFGKGIVQNLIPLGDGTAVKLTTSKYFTPSGFSLHEVGLTPDVEVELSEEVRTQAVIEKEDDNQLQAAIEALEAEENVKEKTE